MWLTSELSQCVDQVALNGRVTAEVEGNYKEAVEG
jgi:hypothetical protein